MTNDFDEYWRKYKSVPYHCKPTSEWLEEVGDKMQHGMVLDESQQYRLSIAIRHAASTCKTCQCPDDR
jgi:hypothetical protein